MTAAIETMTDKAECLTDHELLQLYRRDRESAAGRRHVDLLFERHYQRVALWCYRLMGNREEAADLAQEVFAKAYRYLDSFEGGSSFTTWLYSIARNHCFNACRAKSRGPRFDGDAVLSELASYGDGGAHAQMEQAERVRLMQELMEKTLDETEARVMVLHFGEELPLPAITRMLGLTNASGAKAFIVSAKRKLAVAMRRWRSKETGKADF